MLNAPRGDLAMTTIPVAVLLLTPVSCVAGEVGNGPVPPRNEIVMTAGMSITATTLVGTITITTGKELKRSYTWEGATRSVEMWPRNQRWYGSLRLYFPGPGSHWEPHHGITRGVVEEGQKHFQSVDEAMKWLKDRSYMPLVYRSDRLVVGWAKVPEREQLNVEV
jgi:hypothetical protein